MNQGDGAPHVRRYGPEDLDAVMGAWEAASALAHPFLSEAFLASERHAIPNVYLPATETWVVEVDGAVCGFLSLIGAAPDTEVGAIFVDPAFHGRGAGRALMDRARATRGPLMLRVFEANAVGRRFYARYGFVETGREFHDAAGHALLILRMA